MTITLIPLEVQHSVVLADATQDPDFLRGLRYEEPFNEESARENTIKKIHMEKTKEGIVRSIAIDGTVVGQIGCSKRAELNRYEMWYWIIPSMKGKGFASQAIEEFLRIAPRPLYAIVKNWNEPSKALIRKHGFEETETTYMLK